MEQQAQQAAVDEAKSQSDKNELLAWAATRGLLADAVEIINQGAEPNSRDKSGRRPIHYAASTGSLEVVSYLGSKGAEVDPEDSSGRSPLHYAALGGHAEVVRYLAGKGAWVDSYDSNDDTPLHLAARNADPPRASLTVQQLLSCGAKPSLPNKRSLTPLGEAVLAGRFEAAERLLAAGASLAAARPRGFSLLHLAAGLGDLGAVEYLLKKGADVKDAAAPEGVTPLHGAASAGSEACAAALLRAGADASVADVKGRRPVDVIPEGAAAAAALKALLIKAAKGVATKAPPAAARVPAHASKPAAAPALSADTAPEVYSLEFAQLKSSDQASKVSGFARMSDAELAQLEFLTPAGREAVAGVRRAESALTVHRAVCVLRCDDEFQSDMESPNVVKALEHIRTTGSAERYQGDAQVMGVLRKMGALQKVVRDAGAGRAAQDDVLASSQPPGWRQRDTAVTQRLLDAVADARAAAVHAICAGAAAAPAWPPAPADVARSAGGEVQGEVASTSAPEEPDEYDMIKGTAYDMSLPFKTRFWISCKQALRQALMSSLMMLLVFGVTWAMGRMPGQAGNGFQLHMEQQLQAAAAAQYQHQLQPGEGTGPQVEL